ncbi:MAG: hypothetical protein AAFN81_24900 [Bacteroidota bacterium]
MMMSIRVLLASILVLLSGQLLSQSLVLDLLYTKARNVFRAEVMQIRYEGSNGQGSYFGASLKVEQFYKGKDSFDEVSFGVLKPDVIDLEYDTMIMDYSFHIAVGNSYVFFTDEIVSSSETPRLGVANLSEPEIEGIPYSEALERTLESYDPYTFLVREKTRSPLSTYYVFPKMQAQANAVFFAEVAEINEGPRGIYLIKVLSKTGERTVISKNPQCICKSGQLEVGDQYTFYANEDEAGQFRLIDEWLGIIEASEYDQFRGSK